MTIYSRALSPQRFQRQQSTGLLNLASTPPGAGRPPIPQTSVGPVYYEDAIIEQRKADQAAQQQIMSGLSEIGGLAAIGFAGHGYNWGDTPGTGGGFAGPLLSGQQQSTFGFGQSGGGVYNPTLGYQSPGAGILGGF